jgi:hypothetical protein
MKKLGKECKRPITNGSGRRQMNSAHIPNSKLLKEVAKKKYGEIKHPVVGDIPRT